MDLLQALPTRTLAAAAGRLRDHRDACVAAINWTDGENCAGQGECGATQDLRAR
jgi:hypothetical protein